MNFWTYSPEDVQILIAGVYSVEGLAEGNFIEITKDTQPMQTSRSTDGMVVRKHTTNNSYTINLTLYSASPANDLLTKLWQVDEITGMAKFPLFIKDSSGTGFFFSTTTWIENLPPLVYSTDVTTRVWTFRSSEGIINIGGNDSASLPEIMNSIAFAGIPLLEEVLSNV